MDDLISRQAAIEETDRLFKELSKDCVDMMGIGYNHAVADAVAILKCLPPAEKRGKWVVDGLDHKGGVDWMHCSACGSRMVNVPADHTPFCPNCGASMESEE